jgi:hypothetical protein
MLFASIQCREPVTSRRSTPAWELTAAGSQTWAAAERPVAAAPGRAVRPVRERDVTQRGQGMAPPRPAAPRSAPRRGRALLAAGHGRRPADPGDAVAPRAAVQDRRRPRRRGARQWRRHAPAQQLVAVAPGGLSQFGPQRDSTATQAELAPLRASLDTEPTQVPIGVDPVSWTPERLGRDDRPGGVRCRERDRPTRRPSAPRRCG